MHRSRRFRRMDGGGRGCQSSRWWTIAAGSWPPVRVGMCADTGAPLLPSSQPHGWPSSDFASDERPARRRAAGPPARVPVRVARPARRDSDGDRCLSRRARRGGQFAPGPVSPAGRIGRLVRLPRDQLGRARDGALGGHRAARDGGRPTRSGGRSPRGHRAPRGHALTRARPAAHDGAASSARASARPRARSAHPGPPAGRLRGAVRQPQG